MSGNPFDRTIINAREKPFSSDINQAQAQLDRSLRNLLKSLLSKRTSFVSAASTPAPGFHADGMRVVPQAVPNLTVTVKAGLGFLDVPADTPSAIGGIVGLDDLSTYKPFVLLSDTVLTVPTPPGANSRIDIIEVRPNRLATNPTSRLILDPTTGAANPNTVNKTLAFSLDGSVGTVNDPSPSTTAIGYKVGVVNAVPVEPTVTPGYVKIGRILVGTSVASVDSSVIVDRRPLLGEYGIVRASAVFKVLWNGGVPTVTVISMSCPPGVMIAGIRGFQGGSASRGAIDVYCTGGEFQTATPRWSLLTSNSYIGTIAAHARCRRDFYPLVQQLTSTEQAFLLAATPSINVGVAQQRAAISLEPLEYPAAGGAVLQNTVNMEDISWAVDFDLSY